jgi:dolichol-phosphate mannosyltransferase
MSPAKTFVVLPALNESKALARLIPLIGQALPPESLHILIVNDGSTDDTSSVLSTLSARWPVHELRHSVNQGYAAALRTAYLHILDVSQNPDDLALAMDADGTQGPDYLPALQTALQNGLDAVTASYEMPGGSVSGVPPIRRLFSRVVNGMFRLAQPFPGIQTYTNGFRGYRVSALRRVQHQFGPRLIDENGFAGGTELFLKVAQSGGRLGEVPFALHYEHRGGDSKIRVLPTIRGYLKLISRARSHFS